MRDACLSISLSALQHNFRRVRQLAPHSKIMAMVKAEAYGHGAVLVAAALPQADAFGVAFLEEALMLRRAGITQPIVLLEGVFSAEEMATAVRHQLAVVVHQASQIQFLEQCVESGQLIVWLKLDTGMHRLGFSPEQALQAFQRIRAAKVTKDIGLITHFAAADIPDSEQTVQQIKSFRETQQKIMAVTGLQPFSSLSNSAGVLAWPDAHDSWVRPGIMLYGSSPFADQSAEALQLQPVMTLTSRLIAIQSVKKGQAVGYGGTWVAEKNTRIGIIAIGYGDGYPRHAANGTPVLIEGYEVPLAGRVSMDMIAVDLGDLPLQEGASCVLWGQGLSADRVAAHAGTLSYELFCKVTARVQRKISR